jgi:hypothetical protein
MFSLFKKKHSPENKNTKVDAQTQNNSVKEKTDTRKMWFVAVVTKAVNGKITGRRPYVIHSSRLVYTEKDTKPIIEHWKTLKWNMDIFEFKVICVEFEL